MVLAGRTKLTVSKNFFGGHLFVFAEYLCNRSPKIKTKNIKNYSSILAIVNHPSQQVLVGPSWASCGHLSGPQEWLPMWDPQKYDRGISMGPMCGSPSTIWAAHVGPTNI